ncbi:myosin heavy chain, clone 203-like isoform X2 [Ornithodoros turicata]|uniref:myosin heavy chain, clone 203-like isoform X2 n=1 Tax=Ornithodoros turicata TaxID=34597 RepID=UPI00313971DC
MADPKKKTVVKYQTAATLIIKPNKRTENVQPTSPDPPAEPSASRGSHIKRVTTVEGEISASQVDISIASELQEEAHHDETLNTQEEQKSPGFWELLTEILFRRAPVAPPPEPSPSEAIIVVPSYGALPAPSPPTQMVASSSSSTSTAPSSSSDTDELREQFEICRLDRKQMDRLCRKIDLRGLVRQEMEQEVAERRMIEDRIERKLRRRLRKMQEVQRRLREQRRAEEEMERIEAEKKAKEAEKKAGEAEKKVEEPEKKVEETENKVEVTEKKVEEEAEKVEEVEEKIVTAQIVEKKEQPADLPQQPSILEYPPLVLGEPLVVDVPVVFVFGGPGSGKWTQCEKIVKTFEFTHVSSGDLLRAEVKSDSDRGKEIREIMRKGELVPLEYVLYLLKEAIKSKLETSKGYLIDGYPRNVDQAERFENEVCKCTNLLYFEAKDETMISRLAERGKTSGRIDDQVDTIKRRVEIFHEESQPVLQKYEDLVTRVSAEEDEDTVFDSLKPFFESITKK